MNGIGGARVELWVELRAGRPAVNPVVAEVLRRLGHDGAHVGVRVPETQVADAAAVGRPPPDLVLLKSATSLALSRAVADEHAGVRFLNAASASLSAQDKAWVVTRLAAAGLPVPVTYLVAAEAHVAATDGELGWIAKPVRGLHGAAVAGGRTPAAALASSRAGSTAEWIVDDETRLLQARVGAPDDADLKVYVAGEAMFAAWKRWGPGSHLQDEHLPAELDDATAEMVRSAGEALGLRCFGVDLRLGDGEPWIIDVNPFPGYRGFPRAADALVREVGRALAEDAPR